jgi:amidohydrolase
MMGGDMFKITVTGKGGHGALPHLTIDPIVAGSAIVTAVQTIVSRNVDPVTPGVVTIGSFHAGEAANVIPNTAEMTGTIRTVSIEQREMMLERLSMIATGIGKTLRAEVEIDVPFGVPPTVNTPEMAALVREVATGIIGAERVMQGPLISASEDFSEFLAVVAGCFFMVGTKNDDKGMIWGHHHPRFDIDEEPMSVGMAVMAGTALRFLES